MYFLLSTLSLSLFLSLIALVWHIMLCNFLCSSSSPSSHFRAIVNQNIGEFVPKKNFIDYHTANTIQLFVPINRKFFGSIIFKSTFHQRGIPQWLLDKYCHLFICISLKLTLISGQKLVYTVKTLMSEQIAFAAKLYFGQVFVFCRLISKSVFEWFLLMMCE